MFIIKTTAETIEQVIKNCKHASMDRLRKAKIGDLVLIAQTRHSIENDIDMDYKSIRHLMQYEGIMYDKNNESEKIWGRKWRYIINLSNLKEIKPFNIEDIQISNKKYGAAVKFTYLTNEDEDAVLKWIG